MAIYVAIYVHAYLYQDNLVSQFDLLRSVHLKTSFQLAAETDGHLQ